MTLLDFEQEMVVKCISPIFQQFLGAGKNVAVWADFSWLSTICHPPAELNNCLKEAVQRMIPKNQIRTWKHTRTIRSVDSTVWECQLQGHILPNLTVMFVDVVEKLRLDEDAIDVRGPRPLSWLDGDMVLPGCDFFDQLDFEEWNL
jgi:hypothetical protein